MPTVSRRGGALALSFPVKQDWGPAAEGKLDSITPTRGSDLDLTSEDKGTPNSCTKTRFAPHLENILSGGQGDRGELEKVLSQLKTPNECCEIFGLRDKGRKRSAQFGQISRGH